MSRHLRLWRGLIFGGALILTGCAAADSGAKDTTAPAAPSSSVQGGGFGAYLAAHAARLRDDVGGASDYLSRTIEGDPQNLEVQRLALIYAAADGRFDAAEEAARAVAQARPGDVMAGYVLTAEAARRGDWTAVDTRLAAMPETHLNALLGPLLKAWAAMGRNDADGALARLAPLAGKAALQPVHDFHAALILDLARSDARAESFYDKVLAGEGRRSIHALQAAGRFFNRIGKPARTEALVSAYAAEHGASPLTEALHDSLLTRKVATPLASDAAAGMGEAFFSIATSLTNAEAWEVTLALAQISLRLNPHLDLARVLVGELFEGHDDYARANRAYTAVAADADVAYSVRLRIAKNLERMDRQDEAARTLSDLGSAFPQRPEPLIELGDLYRGDARYAEAVSAYDAAMARIPRIDKRHWVLFYTRGIALERSGQWPRAEADFLKALELEPDQPLVLNYLGYSWLDKGMHLDRAQKMIEAAVAQRPRDGYIVDSLGWAHYQRGNYADAVKQLEQAVVLIADDPTINDHLGDAYWRVGRRLEARYQWRRALDLKPEDAQAVVIRAKLADGLPPAKP